MVRKGIYRKRILLYFSAVFTVFAVLLVSYQIKTERHVKEDVLLSRLDIYAEMVEAEIHNGGALFPCHRILPETLRVTLIDSLGEVMYDSIIGADGQTTSCDSLENHSTRPEVENAIRNGIGYDVRRSETTGVKYFYYARACPEHVIRVALPYDSDVKRVFRPNILFIVISFIIFILAMAVITLLSGYFGHGVSRLHDMIDLEKEKYKEMKHQMTNNIAHELRTPVSSIRGYLETLTMCPDIAPERRKAFIERAYIQTIRLSDLIRDIALITKIEEASNQLVKEDICLKTTVDEVFAEFREEMEKKNVISRNMLDNIHIYGNQTLVYAIFRNLVENSLKYGGGNLTIHVECTGMAGGKCSILYYDTGVGLAKEHLSRIFERFYRVSEGRTRDDGGSGLGLSIVRNAVAYHNGEISVGIRQSGGLEYNFTLSVK